MSDATRTIGIVIVNFASHELIKANVSAMPPSARVVIVDNFHSAAEREAMLAVCADRGWDILPMADNRGFGAAVNAGVALASEFGCECFLLLNPDAQVSAAVVDELRAHVLREPHSIVSPRIVDSEGTVTFQGVELQLDNGRMRRVGGVLSERDRDRPVQYWLTGACLAVHRDMFDRLGGFDEQFFLYWEDVDLSYRAARAGAALVVRDDLAATHDEGGTQGRRQGRAKSETYYYYNARNRLLFAATHLSRPEMLRWLLVTPAASREILLRGGRRQLVHSPRPLLAVTRGTLAGIMLCASALIGRARSRSATHPSSDSQG